MSRTGLALAVASALWVTGCSVAPPVEQDTANASSRQIKDTIEQEIQALLASEERPRYEVLDLRVAGNLEDTLVNSALERSSQDRFRVLLSRAFPDNTLPTGGWLRLRTAQHQHDGKIPADPVLISAALSDGDAGRTRFMVRIESSDSRSVYYSGDGARLVPSWLSHPVDGEYRVTSAFNPSRRHPITGRHRPHNGKDFAAARGTPVLAASDGKVVRAGMRGSWGRLVVLSHADGIETRYAHLSRIEGLSVGDSVTQGQMIGRVGTTGMSTGPHLHFEVHANGHALDPATFDPAKIMRGSGTQLAGQEMQDVRDYQELENKALAMLPTPSPVVLASFGGLHGLGGPDPEDELGPHSE